MSPGVMKIVAKDRGSEMKPFFAAGSEFIEQTDEALATGASQIKAIAEFTAPYKTGRLSENHEVKRLRKFVYQVFNNTPYAFWVHDGTRFMAPRPWLKNAHDEVVGGIIASLGASFGYGGGRKMTMAEAEKELFG